MRLLSLLFTVVVSVVAFAQVPTITSFSPTSGPVGTTVTITGSGFNATAANNSVFFGAIKASVSAATTTSITVTVPSGAGTNQLQYSNTVTKLACISPSPFVIAYTSNPVLTPGVYNTNFALGQSFNSAPGDSFDFFDVNNDGKIDIVYQGLNGSTQSFRSITNSSTSSAPITASNLADATIVSWSGNQYGSGPVATGDFNGDGLIDFNCVSIGYDGTTMVRQTSPGVFTAQPISGVTSLNSSPRVIDFTNDGRLDIFSGYFHPSINFTQHNNTTNLSANPNVITMSFPGSFNMGESTHFGSCAMDFDNNGYLDAAVFTNSFGIRIRPNSAAGFGSLITLSADSSPDVYATDFDGDGKVDLVSAGSGKIQVFRNTSSGPGFISFATVANFSIGNSNAVNAIEIVDMNNDGKPDVLALQSSAIFLFTNNSSSIGSISFSTASQIAQAGNSSRDIALSDLNGDGIPEIVVSGGQVRIFTYTAPPVSASPNSLSGFSTCAGTVSAAQTTSVSGTGLSANITLTAPTGYEISLSLASGYASTLTLTQSGGVVNATTIYVRLNSTATAGTYNANLTAVSGSNTTNIALAGVKIGNPTLTTNPTTTLEQYCYSNPNTTSSITVATSAASPTYQWQISSDNSNFSNVVNGTGGTAATYFPSHVDIMYGNTRYYRCIVTSACGSTTSNSKPFGIYSGLTASAFPSTADQVYCTGATAAALNVNYSTLTNWPTLNYQWKESTDLSTWVDVTSGTGGTTASYTPSTGVVGTKYYRCSVSGTCGSTSIVPSSGAITVKAGLTWNGSASNDPSTSGNWTTCGSGTGTDFNIPAGVPNYPEYTNLTISAGQTVTVESGARLTVNGILTNDGTLIINSGATLVQGSTSTIAGSGNYIVKQIVSGIGQIVAPAGRFWYLGSPVTTATSSVFFTNLTTNNTVVKKRNESNNSWTQIASGTPENLEVGRGYYAQIRPVASSSLSQNVPLTFSGTINNNPTSSALTINCTRTTGQGFEGFNLVSNPYPSYLDWDLVTKTNVGNTMWYRTATGTASNTMVFETYVAGAAGGIGTNLSGNVATKLIPPMQAFWVRVNSGNTTGSIVLDNSMRAHFTSFSGSTAGLRSTNDELKVFLRMNLLQEDKKDQLIVYMNGAATNGFDILDGEKMMQAGFPQFYTQAGDKKIVINGLNSAKKQQSLPVTVELPTTGVHTIQVENLELEAGLVWLEDAQEGTMNVLNPGFNYEFYGEAGINTDRFVLHFNILDNSAPSAPNYGEVSSSANFSGKGASVHAESAGVVVIKLPASTEGITDIQIRDAAGRIVYTGSTHTLETSVQLSQANGIYYVTLNSNAGVEVRKVFIQQ